MAPDLAASPLVLSTEGDTLTRPTPTDTGDHDRFAHYVRKTDIASSATAGAANANSDRTSAVQIMAQALKCRRAAVHLVVAPVCCACLVEARIITGDPDPDADHQSVGRTTSGHTRHH